ncbi:hypothetical protein VcPa08_01426, partial [Vibrio cholerae]
FLDSFLPFQLVGYRYLTNRPLGAYYHNNLLNQYVEHHTIQKSQLIDC